jgi:hypothetical protein
VRIDDDLRQAVRQGIDIWLLKMLIELDPSLYDSWNHFLDSNVLLKVQSFCIAHTWATLATAAVHPSGAIIDGYHHSPSDCSLSTESISVGATFGVARRCFRRLKNDGESVLAHWL